MQQSCCIVWHRVAVRSETDSAARLSNHEDHTAMATLTEKTVLSTSAFVGPDDTTAARCTPAIPAKPKRCCTRSRAPTAACPWGMISAPPTTSSTDTTHNLTLHTLIAEFKATRYTVAASTLSTEKTHLAHLETSLAAKLDQPCDQVIQRDLDRHLLERRRKAKADTVSKERATIVQLFRWAVEQGYLQTSPANKLAKLKGAAERQKFRTLAEIQAVIDRGGLGAR